MGRPPLGLVPKKLWDEKRFNEVCSAITRYYQDGLKIPIEWVKEYNELIDKIHEKDQKSKD